MGSSQLNAITAPPELLAKRVGRGVSMSISISDSGILEMTTLWGAVNGQSYLAPGTGCIYRTDPKLSRGWSIYLGRKVQMW